MQITPTIVNTKLGRGIMAIKHTQRGMGGGKTHGVVSEAHQVLHHRKRETTERIIWAKRVLYRHKVIGWDDLTPIEQMGLTKH